MRPVEEVLVVVQERDDLLQNLQVGHRDQLLQRVDQIHVVQLVLEFTVVIRTNLRVRERMQLLRLQHVEQRRAEPALVFDWLQHPTALQQTQKIEAFPAGRDHIYEIPPILGILFSNKNWIACSCVKPAPFPRNVEYTAVL